MTASQAQYFQNERRRWLTDSLALCSCALGCKSGPGDWLPRLGFTSFTWGRAGIL